MKIKPYEIKLRDNNFILGVKFMLTIISYIGVLVGAVGTATFLYLAAVKVKLI